MKTIIVFAVSLLFFVSMGSLWDINRQINKWDAENDRLKAILDSLCNGTKPVFICTTVYEYGSSFVADTVIDTVNIREILFNK